MINISLLLSAVLQQQLKKKVSAQTATFTFFAVWAKMKIIQLYVRGVLQNILQLKVYFLRSWLRPFHYPSGSLSAAPCPARGCRSLVSPALLCAGLWGCWAMVCPHLHWFSLMGISDIFVDLYCKRAWTWLCLNCVPSRLLWLEIGVSEALQGARRELDIPQRKAQLHGSEQENALIQILSIPRREAAPLPWHCGGHPFACSPQGKVLASSLRKCCARQ